MTTLNVSGPSTFRDVSAQNIDISETLHVIGPSTLKDVSAQNISGTLHVNVNVTSPNLVYITGNQNISGTKTFTNTINGNISGNAGSVTNGIYTSGGQTINGTTTLNNLSLTGKISSLKFRTIKPVNNLKNFFSKTSTATSVTIANNVIVNGGTLVFYIQIIAQSKNTGHKTFTLECLNSANVVRVSIPLSYHFNKSNRHHSWSFTHVVTGIASETLKINLKRNDTNLVLADRDNINVTIDEMPY